MSPVFRVRLNAEARSVHVATLASLAIAQPLFDVLGKAPDFLLAHDLGPSEIAALVVVLGFGVPFVCGALIALLARVHIATARVAVAALIALFAGLIVMYAVRNVPAAAEILIGASLVAGIVAGVLHYRLSAVRLFTAWLSPGIVLVPLLFLLRPGVQSLLWPQEHEIQQSRSSTPVVLVVFDGLPLTALLDEKFAIDRARYPSFAALADGSTWYRNATTVADYTRWAMPAILSGRYPSPQALPMASDHPETLFTLLGSSHTVRVHEPISRLCPQTLCDYGGEGVVRELENFAGPLSAAYLHTIFPEDLEQRLPPLDQGWVEGVPPSDSPGAVWLRGGDRSRRGEALAFIDGIGPEGELPSFDFLHVLLPHTPLAYLPTGHRYGTERFVPGLLEGGRDRWLRDDWAVTQGYRRFLLQVGYVDTLLGQLVDRLKETGLYDRALIVVTSDHGASFKAGRPFRRVTDDTFMDIMPVPLLIKAPGQREGTTSDRNVETVDILPTIAGIMGIELPWKIDGVSAVGNVPAKGEKRIYHEDARQVKRFPPTLRDAMQASIDRKRRLFGVDANPSLIPRTSPYAELIGREVDDLRVSDVADDLEFALDAHGDFSNVDPDGRFLPAHIAGRARWRHTDDPAVLAVAVDGIVRVTTRTYRFEDRGLDHSWALLIPPDVFHKGDNEVEVFVVRPSEPPVLHRTHFSHARPVDLLSNAAAYGMRVSSEGLYEREGRERWTNGAARIVVPRGNQSARSLRIILATTGPSAKDVRIRANGCEVFNGSVSAARWSQIFKMPECKDDEDAFVIEVISPVHPDPSSGRPLGVALERIELLEHAWPPPSSPLPERDRRSQIRFSDKTRDGDSVKSTGRLAVTVSNRGTSVWAGPADLGGENGAVRLAILWFRRGQTARPAAVQRVELPHALLPGDRIELTFDLVPTAADGTRLPPGEYDAWIGMMQEGVAWFYASGDSVRKLRVIHDARP